MVTRNRDRTFLIGLVVVFLLASSVRVALPASKYTVWYERSLGFWEALLQGDRLARSSAITPA